MAIYQPLYQLISSNPNEDVSATPKAGSRRKLVLGLRIALAAVVVLSVGVWLMNGTSSSAATLPQKSRPSKRVYLRAGGLTREGLGSYFHHFKTSIVLSRALDSELVLAFTESDHHYSTSDILNFNAPVPPMDTTKACSLTDYIANEGREGLVRALCAGNPQAEKDINDIKDYLADCTSIIDPPRRYTTQDLNGCIAEWTRERLALPPPSSPIAPLPLCFPPSRPITIAAHIRWGDTGHSDTLPTHFRGSMPLPAIAGVVSDLRALAGEANVKLTLAIESASPSIIGQLNDPEVGMGLAPFEILDTGEPWADLQQLSNHDILLLGESSSGVLAHMIAPAGGLTIAEMDGHKYDNTSDIGRALLRINDYNPEWLRRQVFGEFEAVD
ncbi:hypothetical protein FB45DRAFT_1033779 [Roridomyces roridus]|uniref:Uncharacterized protein n=1 Tax=Roridomyces roridus TaxID=1738132 RepID=A0AAD7BE54_9AGAR|nr:hypothetical protein FB45DRAFT_1033779 [Roridomyces roridus]